MRDILLVDGGPLHLAQGGMPVVLDAVLCPAWQDLHPVAVQTSLSQLAWQLLPFR